MLKWGLVLLFAASAALAGEPLPAEKLLLGFEKEEIEAAMKKGNPKAPPFWPDGDEFLFLQKSVNSGGYDWGYQAPRISPEKATQGKYALKPVVPITDTADSPPPRPRIDRNWALFYTTTGDPARFYDALLPRDWSGYPLLRIDFRVERSATKADTVIIVDFGDLDLDPPPACPYAVPTDTWVTLEVDLERAAKERGLQLDQMCYLMLRLGPLQKARKEQYRRNDEKATFYIDNIRLATRSAKAEYPVLRDDTPFTFTPKHYAVEYDLTKDEKGQFRYSGWKQAGLEMPKPGDAKPEPGPAKLEGPFVIDLTAWDKEIDCAHLESLSLCEDIAAFDPKRILLPFRCSVSKRWFFAHDVAITLAIGTLDGGTTWKGLDGDRLPTLLMAAHHAPGETVAIGGELLLFADWGCQNPGHNYPADKGFCRRTVFTGETWWLSPFYFVDAHGHHCVGFQTGTRLASGRLWALWEHPGRARTELCAKYSDDSGATWHGWREPGKVPVIPDLTRCNSASIVPYGEHVAVVVRDGSYTGRISFFDGKTWSKPAPSPSAYQQRAVSVGARDIYVYGNGGVWRWDGNEWKHEFAAGGHAKGGALPELAVCGQTVLCFDRDKTMTKILCWRRTRGEWKGPEEVASEETAITDFSTQRYAPADFAPLAYVCKEADETVRQLVEKGANARRVRRYKPWIKVLKVPAENPPE